jgi:phosphoesterase RecJ-like protein
MEIPTELLALIRESRSFLIVTHVKPEGDAIGSSLALGLGLKKMGKEVCLLDMDPVPDTLKFLPASDLFRQKAPPGVFDVLLLVDCNTLERTGFKKLQAARTSVIDHHILSGDNERSVQNGQISGSYIDPGASATGELVYNLLCELKVTVDKEIATNLYTAILVDTGGFRYSSTTPESLNISSYLVEAGAEPWGITKEVYENIPFRAMRLLSLAFSSLEMKGSLAWITVTEAMLKEAGAIIEDTENFVNYPRKIKGVEVAVLFREGSDGSCKVSLRSKGRVNVAFVAEKFGGGGHAAAAGCKLQGSLQEVKKQVLDAVKNAVDEL